MGPHVVRGKVHALVLAAHQQREALAGPAAVQLRHLRRGGIRAQVRPQRLAGRARIAVDHQRKVGGRGRLKAAGDALRRAGSPSERCRGESTRRPRAGRAARPRPSRKPARTIPTAMKNSRLARWMASFSKYE